MFAPFTEMKVLKTDLKFIIYDCFWAFHQTDVKWIS